MAACVHTAAAFALLAVLAGTVRSEGCVARAHIDAGWLCGRCDLGEDGRPYASFLAVPYAAQPLGQLRFKELQEADKWEGYRDATEEGPVCPQRDLLYGRLMQTRGMSEECIHANVYVPLAHLPAVSGGGAAGERPRRPLPVLVFVHGGGFAFGSGDPDIHGPQYLLQKDIVVITFNYRIGPFGFLSLNSSSVPGNAGLRDIVTLLRWVQRNAKAFGGDPDNVTLAGQSAGATSAHLLTLSPAAEGLFKRAIMMSGAGARSFVTTSPVYAQYIAQMFLQGLGIAGGDDEAVHAALAAAPLEKILEVNSQLQDFTGITAFMPVVETPHPGVEMILDGDPEALQAAGRGKDIPLMIGFTELECEFFRPRFENIKILDTVELNPVILLPPGVIYTTPEEGLKAKILEIENRYFNGNRTMDKYVKLCSESYFIYPAMKVAETRAAEGGAPVFLYQFSYDSGRSVLRDALHLHYEGAAHVEDLTYVFRTNSYPREQLFQQGDQDDSMKDVMTSYVTNFMRTSDPSGGKSSWPPVKPRALQYRDVGAPAGRVLRPTAAQLEMIKFFDKIYTNS